MKNYVQPGNTITLTAPYAVASGDGLLVGSIFGVASGTAALGVPTALASSRTNTRRASNRSTARENVNPINRANKPRTADTT